MPTVNSTFVPVCNFIACYNCVYLVTLAVCAESSSTLSQRLERRGKVQYYFKCHHIIRLKGPRRQRIIGSSDLVSLLLEGSANVITYRIAPLYPQAMCSKTLLDHMVRCL
ncbi:hypothetical protein AVEN_84235-1 [Araneus ventricosus]|uniref:Uncharacterized protein n=1 Tax=Araneus ventricosus TaxID=182803 RepID=A0A4Y2L1D8_ARAVE|nr:hypothetical protein AVEN_84235-1 [Araneus ventricosus]